MSGVPLDMFWAHRSCKNVEGSTDSQTDNIVICTIMVRVHSEHAKSSCAPLIQYKAMLCTTKLYVGTELHCKYQNTIPCLCALMHHLCTFVVKFWSGSER